MIKFMFDPIDSEQPDYYGAVTLSWVDGSEDTVDKLIDKFTAFVRALGYMVNPGEITFQAKEEDTDADI